MSQTSSLPPVRLSLADAEAWEARARRQPELAQELEGQSGEGALWALAVLDEQAGQPMRGAGRLAALAGLAGDLGSFCQLARVRMALAAGDADTARVALRLAIRTAESGKMMRAANRLLKQLRRQGGAGGGLRSMRIALEGAVTLDLLAEQLAVQCWAEGIDAEMHVGPFGQMEQQILDPRSALGAFAPETVILLPPVGSLGLDDQNGEEVVEEQAARFRRLWRQSQERWGAFTLQCNFEVPLADPLGRLSAAVPGGRAWTLRRLNQALWEAASAEPGVAVFDLDQTAAAYGKRRWSDPVLWYAAKQYPAAAALPALSRELAATLRAVAGRSSKCLVLDLDNTLWGGVVGEDGVADLKIGGPSPAGEAYADFQRYVRGLSRRGILLAVCSKNDDADARRPFREHPEMILREEEIAVFLANWKPKDENLREIARTINIGLDSLVFVDDNPAERARVRQYLPEVEVIELPPDPAYYVAAVEGAGLWEPLSITAEDRMRTGSIRSNAERQALEVSSGSVDEYLAGLGMEVELAPFDEVNLPRIVQLINKTNQFNLTTRRATEAEVRQVMDGGCYTQAMRVRDRFGDSGLTGVLIARPVPDGDWRIETWLMSCRVLGRRLDEVMMAALDRAARRRGARRLIGEYRPTAKNGLVADLYERLSFTRGEPAGDGWWYQRELASSPAFVFPPVGQCEDRTAE
jgi:FkbH-like protein